MASWYMISSVIARRTVPFTRSPWVYQLERLPDDDVEIRPAQAAHILVDDLTAVVDQRQQWGARV